MCQYEISGNWKINTEILTNILKTNLKNSGIGKIVEPMVWVYIEDIDRYNYIYL